MRFSCTGTRVVRVVWALILTGVVASMLTTLALGLTGLEYPGLDVPSSPLEQMVSLTGLVLVALLLGAPFFTAHEVGTRSFIIRQGILFHAAIPFDEIAAVDLGTRRPIGLGVRWYPGVLFVVTWPSNLVEIRLRRSRAFRLVRLVPLPAVHTVVVNADDPFGLLLALRERVPPLSGKHANGEAQTNDS